MPKPWGLRSTVVSGCWCIVDASPDLRLVFVVFMT